MYSDQFIISFLLHKNFEHDLLYLYSKFIQLGHSIY